MPSKLISVNRIISHAGSANLYRRYETKRRLGSAWPRKMNENDHVLRFLEAYDDYRHIFVVTEICLGGNLLRWAVKAKGDTAFASRVAREITGALVHCHARGICHRDLKLENVLLVRDAWDSPVRIADLGLAKRCSRRVLLWRLQNRSAGVSSEVDQGCSRHEVPLVVHEAPEILVTRTRSDSEDVFLTGARTPLGALIVVS